MTRSPKIPMIISELYFGNTTASLRITIYGSLSLRRRERLAEGSRDHPRKQPFLSFGYRWTLLLNTNQKLLRTCPPRRILNDNESVARCCDVEATDLATLSTA